MQNEGRIRQEKFVHECKIETLRDCNLTNDPVRYGNRQHRKYEVTEDRKETDG